MQAGEFDSGNWLSFQRATNIWFNLREEFGIHFPDGSAEVFSIGLPFISASLRFAHISEVAIEEGEADGCAIIYGAQLRKSLRGRLPGLLDK